MGQPQTKPEKSEWAPPASIDSLFESLAGNKFAAINSDTAGAKNDNELPKGKAEFQLYSLATPNGQKASIGLEEFEVDYDAHRIDIMKGEQHSKGFVEVNPNSKIPAMKHGDVRVFESVNILLYLAEKYKKFLPLEGPQRAECLSWLFWQVGSQGPMFGQFGHFYRYAPRDKHEVINYGVARYGMEVRRLLSVMDQHLDGKTWFVGEEYTIVDMALFPWVNALGDSGYGAGKFLGVDERYPHVKQWCDRVRARPAVQRGLLVCGSPESQKQLEELRKTQKSEL